MLPVMESLTDGKSFRIRNCFRSATSFIRDSPALTCMDRCNGSLLYAGFVQTLIHKALPVADPNLMKQINFLPWNLASLLLGSFFPIYFLLCFSAICYSLQSQSFCLTSSFTCIFTITLFSTITHCRNMSVCMVAKQSYEQKSRKLYVDVMSLFTLPVKSPVSQFYPLLKTFKLK